MQHWPEAEGSRPRGGGNFQVMRRTHASLISDLGVEEKLMADQLGHSLDVNQNVYTQSAVSKLRLQSTGWKTRLLVFKWSSLFR